jgi:hypothetical protein
MPPRVFRPLILLLFAAGCVSAALAQTVAPAAAAADPRNFDATQFGERITLGPNWLFAPGDDPAWASPTFDDSGWKTIATGKQLLDYGIRDIPFAWYRTHIHLRPGTRNLMVGTTDIDGQYEIFANGVRIGGTRDMIGRLSTWQDSLIAYGVPDNLIAGRSDLVLAIRCRLNWGSSLGHGASTPLSVDSVYLVSRESAPIAASYVDAHNAGPRFLLSCLSLLASSISFALFFALPRQREYLAIAVYLFCSCVVSGITVWSEIYLFSFPLSLCWFIVLGVEAFALIEFVRLVLRMPRTRWLLALEIVAPLAFLLQPIHELGFISHNVYFAGFSLPLLFYKVLLPLLLLRGWRRGNREAGLLLPAILIGSLADYWEFFRELVIYAKLDAWLPLFPYWFAFGSYQLDIYLIGDFIFDFTILFFLVLRTVRIARERTHAAAELDAARTVQQVLIPEETPSVPGFAIHSVYRPAGQVGGDFFQILAMSEGGVLVVIGDVSGKGLPAAMTVSLLVGTVRTLAHYTQCPGEILAAMNQRMMARSGGGFTTCLVLRADRDGTLTVANAGHISPYLNGKEQPLENGLPLGLSAETTYAESIFQLAPEQQLTLLTDGVVEARDKTGALYGFEATAALSTQTAEAIADAAQAFGQDDDITVLTLNRLAPARATAGEQATPILLPA